MISKIDTKGVIDTDMVEVSPIKNRWRESFTHVSGAVLGYYQAFSVVKKSDV
jgi:hypothetical protein